MLGEANGIKTFLKPGDIFLVDRGFRDALTKVENAGYILLMSSFKGKKRQLPTEDTNSPRLGELLCFDGWLKLCMETLHNGINCCTIL